MLTDEVKDFISTNHKAVLTTYRGNGNAQMSIIVVGPYREGAAFTTTADRAKLRNLKRDPRCTLLVSQDSWWGFLVFLAVSVFLVHRWGTRAGLLGDPILSVAVWAIIGGIVGARVVHVIDFWGEIYQDDLVSKQQLNLPLLIVLTFL